MNDAESCIIHRNSILPVSFDYKNKCYFTFQFEFCNKKFLKIVDYIVWTVAGNSGIVCIVKCTYDYVHQYMHNIHLINSQKFNYRLSVRKKRQKLCAYECEYTEKLSKDTLFY